MPTKEVIESTMKNHFESWNAKDKDRWIANWDENVVMYDPVGGPDKQGIAAIEDTWENSFKEFLFMRFQTPAHRIQNMP